MYLQYVVIEWCWLRALSLIDSTDAAAEVLRERERRLRLETCMKMRAIYLEKQKRWQHFREAENQRRMDKARVKEMDRLNDIIEQSRARREYSNSKFQQTLNVRSHHHAAVVIQRAFRRVRRDRVARARVSREEAALVRREMERAALVIQRSWRLFRQQKLFKAMHFRSIMAGPVIAVGKRLPSPPGVHSYERGISITGMCSLHTDKAVSATGSYRTRNWG